MAFNAKLPEVIFSPLELYVDAFPDSASSIASYQGVISVMAITVDISQIDIAIQEPASWLTIQSKDVDTKAATLTVKLAALQNTGAPRKNSISVTCSGRIAGIIRVEQYGGAFVQARLRQLLGTPMTMDYGIAAKYLAEQVAKIPEPFTTIGVIVVVLIIVAVDMMASTIRHSFVNIPEPAALAALPAGAILPPSVDLSSTPTPVEDNVILNQTILTVLYFIETVYGGGE